MTVQPTRCDPPLGDPTPDQVYELRLLWKALKAPMPLTMPRDEQGAARAIRAMRDALADGPPDQFGPGQRTPKPRAPAVTARARKRNKKPPRKDLREYRPSRVEPVKSKGWWWAFSTQPCTCLMCGWDVPAGARVVRDDRGADTVCAVCAVSGRLSIKTSREYIIEKQARKGTRIPKPTPPKGAGVKT